MPGPRLEKAELFVVHLIHFAEKFDDDPIRTPVIDRNIVSNDVAARSPGERDLVFGQQIAGAFDVGPVTHFKRDMMDRVFRVTEKIHGVVVAATTQKCEEITAPVGDAET